MAWTRDTTSGATTHSTTAIEFALVGGASARLPALFSADFQLSDIAHHVRVVILASADGGSGWEIGIATDGDAVETDLMIRRRVFGTPENTTASQAHSITAGTPFTLRIEILDNETINAYLIAAGEIKATVTHNNVTGLTFSGNTAWGYLCDVDGAVVLSGRVTTLSKTTANVNEAPWWVAGGDLAASFDQRNATLVQSRVFPPDVDVSGVAFENYVYLVGGGRARRMQAITRVVDNWAPTSGTLPGQTVAGKTTANGVFNWGKSVGLFLDRDAPNRIYLSAIGDPLDFNTGSTIFGAAIVIALPEPVASVSALSDQVLLIACTRSVYVLLGDPRLGGSELRPISSTLGATGAGALATRLTQGRNLIHTAQGVMQVGVDGLAQLSYPILREPLRVEVAESSDYLVQICHEPQNSLVFVFKSHRTDPTKDKMIVYHELVGGYDPGAGGWMIDEYDSDAVPMASCTWQGKALMGGRDGVVRWFSADYDLDDEETDIENYCPFALIDAPGLENDVILNRLQVLLSKDSGDVTVTVYGGSNPENAFGPATRTQKYRQTFTTTTPPVVPRVRDSALVAVVSSASDEQWMVQSVEAGLLAGLRTSRHPRPVAAALAAPTSPGTPPIGGTDNPAGDGPDLPDNQPGGPDGTKVH